MIESGRKHGPFDARYPVRRKIPTTVWELRWDRDGFGRLEWSTFLARHFPNRRRHDFKALAAYDAYRNAFGQAASPQCSGTQRLAVARGTDAGGGDVVSPAPRAKRVLAATDAAVAVRRQSRSPALVDWESEGGSVERDLA